MYQYSTKAEVLQAALSFCVKERGEVIPSPQQCVNWMRLKLSPAENEQFWCLFMDNRNRVIELRKMFDGTVDGASVYPREVVKAALAVNAAAVVLAHNHPSGVPEPSSADKQITERLKQALALVDVRVLDHLVVGDEVVSFAERGLL